MDLREAIEYAIDGDAILFVGSGFSRSSLNVEGNHLFTGSQLSKFLGDACGLSDEADLNDVADLYVTQHGSTSLVNLLRRLFLVKEHAQEHTVYGRVPWKRIYTTNYDNTIELAFKGNGRPVVPLTIKENIQRVREASTQCVHINGYIDALSDQTIFNDFRAP